ncbi:NifU family protein [Neorickettsia findlayensis]|uniref:NifU family protein n=1 Tax=Neorickettsia findlayensis TaxID=2686014 RepID=A0A6P1GB94_9RICK|nr:NifU family protein [Neorickettsia findlayensis]QHD65434.1 NifU family protein [Neorickettsia findlayensis]
MFIQTEHTPNPNVLKFFPGVKILDSGIADFSTAGDAFGHKLPEMLWQIQGVSGVMLGVDFVSVSKTADAEWDILKPQIFSVIVEYFTAGSDLVRPVTEDEEVECVDEVSKKIREIIDTKVRPSVVEDGGNVVFKGYKDGVVYLKLQGACAGCPSASVTLKDGIENLLQYYVPEVREVQQV